MAEVVRALLFPPFSFSSVMWRQVTEEYDLHNLETGGIGAQVPYHNALA